MPTVQINLPTFDGWAFTPEDAKFGEAESAQIPLLRSGRVQQIQIVRRSLTLSLKGIPLGAAIAYIDQVRGLPAAQVYGSTVTRDITIGGYTLRQAILVKATPSAPISFAGGEIMPSLELEFHSELWE